MVFSAGFVSSLGSLDSRMRFRRAKRQLRIHEGRSLVSLKAAFATSENAAGTRRAGIARVRGKKPQALRLPSSVRMRFIRRAFHYNLRNWRGLAAVLPGKPVAMKEDDENTPRRAPSSHEVGQALTDLSVAELEERIMELRVEILRLEAARDEKRAASEAADSFFKR
jgi:uncharacterized small protein (DUF1192 family)